MPTSRAARRRLLHFCDENTGSGTTTGAPRPGEATGPTSRGQGPDASEGGDPRGGPGYATAPWPVGGGSFRAFGPGSAELLPRVRGSGQEPGWPGSLGADPARTGADTTLCCPGLGLQTPSVRGLVGSGREAGGPAAAGCGRPASSVHLACGSVPVPVPSGQEVPLAQEEAPLAPASETLSPERRCRVGEGLRHRGQARETAAGGPEATRNLGTALPGGPTGGAPAVTVGSGRPEGGSRENGPAPQPPRPPQPRCCTRQLGPWGLGPQRERFQARCLLSLVPRPDPRYPVPPCPPHASLQHS